MEDGPTLSLGASIAASGNADAYGGKNGFNDLTLIASVALPLGQISITPMVGFASVEEGDFNFLIKFCTSVGLH